MFRPTHLVAFVSALILAVLFLSCTDDTNYDQRTAVYVAGVGAVPRSAGAAAGRRVARRTWWRSRARGAHEQRITAGSSHELALRRALERR